jgi:anaerobic selenocysteine-containing dehydrogenase
LQFGGEAVLPFSSPEWFKTPSGKAEFYSESFAAEGLDPLPAFVPPVESRNGLLKDSSHAQDQYPLEMLPRKADNWMNSTFANLAVHQHMEQKTLDLLEMHADDATPRGIRNGDVVVVFNGRGSIKLYARVNGAVRPGVVAARLGWNKLGAENAGVNVLTQERLTDFGGGPVFYSTLVDVRKSPD